MRQLFQAAAELDLVGNRRGAIAFELFNLFNSNTVLARYINLGSSESNRIDGILAPRIARIVAKVRF